MDNRNVRVDGDIILLSTKRISELFGVTPKTMRVWGKSGCPQEDRGWWNLDAVYHWRIGTDNSNEKSEGESWQGKKLKAEAEYRTAKAEQESIRLNVLRGDFVSFGDVKNAWCERLIVVKTNMFAWIHTLPQLLEGLSRGEIERILESEVQGLWEAYAQDGPFTPRIAGRNSIKTDQKDASGGK